ncbi:hypothetical protein LZ838_11140 [Pseudomonas sp. AA27]|uniref:hypothetical protein n=1 Tax=Pseudomonas sp. AA27 TaxID=2908652 RepID=UPI001F2B00BC|nr:hypothetical protein [Pseudomonas sp. AA27]MCF1487912.1 hypothetical protein [Pseudomonas sp. AA27]
MLEMREVEKLRQLGLTEHTSGGAEAVRVTAQCRQVGKVLTREDLRSRLVDWQRQLEQRLAIHGAELIEGSLSVSGQTVEAVVPILELSQVMAEMSEQDVRIDIVKPRQVVSR